MSLAQLVGRGGDGLGRSPLRFLPAQEGAQGAVGAMQRVGRQTQGRRRTVGAELGLISTSGREIRTRPRRTALPPGRRRESSSLSSQHQDRRDPAPVPVKCCTSSGVSWRLRTLLSR